MLANCPGRIGRDVQPVQKGLVRLWMAGLKRAMQSLLLRIGDTGFVEDRDELVFGDGVHG